jgi:agmatine/peptidylarginine deiminase
VKALVRTALIVLALAPGSALANDYLSNDANDWYRYQGAQTGQLVNAQIENAIGGWRLWNDWAGMGPTWVYTSANHDYFWLWNGQTYVLMANLSGQVGEQRAVDLNCNQGTVTILGRGSVTTPAGTFNDVVRLGLTPSCSDAGVTSIWVARGVGIVKYAYQSIMGEQTFELQMAMVGGNQIGGGPVAPTTPSTPTVGFDRAPAEHETMEAILWGANDTYIVLDTYRDAFRGLNGSGVVSDVTVVSQGVASQLRYEMAAANVPMDDVQIYVSALDTVWMRDYGPIVMKRADGSRYVADLEYYYGRPRDDDFPRVYADFRGWSTVKVDVGYEGGNYATDGKGLQILSNGVKWFNRDKTTSQIEREFRDTMNTQRFMWVEPLVDEGTTHVDMFLRIMNDDTALVSRYPANHRQTPICDAAAAKLRAEGYNVIRVDVDHTYDEFATYTNSVVANGIALVPTYTNSTKNQNALRAYESAGYKAISADARLIIRYSGATHCVSMQVPAGN